MNQSSGRARTLQGLRPGFSRAFSARLSEDGGIKPPLQERGRRRIHLDGFTVKGRAELAGGEGVEGAAWPTVLIKKGAGWKPALPALDMEKQSGNINIPTHAPHEWGTRRCGTIPAVHPVV